MHTKPDLILANIDEYVVSESIASVPAVATNKAKTSESKPKSVSEPIIEDWVSDSEDENETETESKQRKPSFAKVEFVKPNEQVKTPRESVKQEEHNKQAKHLRKNSQSPRGNKRNWNNLMSQRLGNDFKMLNKACYMCGSFKHLQYTYKHNKGLLNGQRVVRPIGDSSRKVNHQNSPRMSNPHQKRNFVPSTVLMRSGFKKLNTARQKSSRAVVSINTARQTNTAYSRPIVNSARPVSNVFNRAHSHDKRPYQIRTSLTNKNFSQKVNTTKEKFNTARPNSVVVNDVRENQVNAVKVSACWVWRPTKLNSGSITLKKHNYIDARGRSKSKKGVIDSGCSRHMTGNMSYLSEYEEIDGGYVAIGGDPKGGESSSAAAARPAGGLKADYEFVATINKEIGRDPEREETDCDFRDAEGRP
nr:retrotransposon Orf1 [Tanacetum cinerariifolium]